MTNPSVSTEHIVPTNDQQMRMMALQNFMEAYKLAGDPSKGAQKAPGRGDSSKTRPI